MKGSYHVKKALETSEKSMRLLQTNFAHSKMLFGWPLKDQSRFLLINLLIRLNPVEFSILTGSAFPKFSSVNLINWPRKASK